MKIYILLVSIIMMLGSYSSSAQDFKQLSQQLENKCTGLFKSTRSKSCLFTFHNLRSKLYAAGKLDFINNNQDTLYILESYDIQGGSYRGRMWNRNGLVQYRYDYDSGFTFNNYKKMFTDYTIELIQKWDIVSIREEEQLYSNIIPVFFIYSSRIIFGNKPRTDCLRFKEFFNSKRDHIPYPN